MPHLQICFGVVVWYQVGTIASKLHCPIGDDDDLRPHNTHSRFRMQIKGSTDLMSGSNACSDDVVKVAPRKDDDTLSAHMKLDVILTEILPHPSSGNPNSRRLPVTTSVELGHKHFKGPNYDTLLAMSDRDLASDAMQAHRWLSKQMYITEDKEGFRPLVHEALAQIVIGPVKSTPEIDDVWLGDLDACVSGIDEVLYIEAFNGAWVHLQEFCAEHEEFKAEYQRDSKGQGSGERR